MKKILILLTMSFSIVFATTIYDIQHGDVPLGTTVTIQGIVTAGSGETPDGTLSFYIQDGAGPYNGIYVNNSDYEVLRGDLVELYGDYIEYDGKSEINEPENLEVLSSGNTLPDLQGSRFIDLRFSIILNIVSIQFYKITPQNFIIGIVDINTVVGSCSILNIKAECTIRGLTRTCCNDSLYRDCRS
jgi:hypothetical protein